MIMKMIISYIPATVHGYLGWKEDWYQLSYNTLNEVISTVII